MIVWILGTLAVVALVFVLLSPLESLSWWADRGEREVRQTFELLSSDSRDTVDSHRFLVYLSGVGVLGGDELSGRELSWLESVDAELPDVRVVADVFPYSVDNRGLLQRATVWLWGFLDRVRRRKYANPVHFLINLRNITQVLVSSDPRYGPTQSIGLAQEIWRSLQRHGYVPGSGDPVYLVGFSGGAQMALGAGWFLRGIGVPVSLISIGGIFGDDPGLDRMGHVWHLTGSKDKMHYLGDIAFPGRWPTAPLSSWGRAKRDGRITAKVIGPMQHDGAKAYFGRRAVGPDGRNHADITRDEVVAILREPAPAAPTLPAG
ncbi:hypothetical protein SAMN02745244_03753 [Tessaracoccus bendigoensis DSM 12906]|uniref:Alpha/beta hydrolase family protein n=1 Tax=Tessaracoccus bendigoensis DSM 12906 TaxID=1123357 RepID=A0A1M6NZV7_9ACTN|nr:hypothetical protein [Tessaracoccus bendigoensis]SHK01211.1 hypothetical protein SAMN02745244_03753 [Tessaracoccus bendigoensis DSM 12906]